MATNIGTFIPISSLRSSAPECAGEPNGTLATAHVFLEWLRRTGQTAWQVLPLSQTHLEPESRATHVPSPYKGYGVGVDPKYFSSALGIADPSEGDLKAFVSMHEAWAGDYALFCALRDAFGTDDWRAWPPEIRRRDRAALERWSREHANAVRDHLSEQWRLHEGFRFLRERARELGIKFIGDLPFYVPVRSPLVWAKQECFDLTENGSMRRVSGVPIGPMTHYGRQVWGHPLYRWDTPGRAKLVADLWKMRIRHVAELYDFVRIDHAKGFYHFGAMDPEHPEHDEYLPGPGTGMLEEVINYARSLGLEPFAEDAGDRLAELRETLHAQNIPGIRMFRFAYNEKKKRFEHDYLHIDEYPSNGFAYTTTHDTDTLMGYLAAMSADEKLHLAEHTRVAYSADDRELAVRFRRRVIDSPAGTVIVPLQDWLLTAERINVPGTELPVGDPNWRWRMPRTIEELDSSRRLW